MAGTAFDPTNNNNNNDKKCLVALFSTDYDYNKVL
jgi:hypothetical protein